MLASVREMGNLIRSYLKFRHPSYQNAYILVYEKKNKTQELVDFEKQFQETNSMAIEEDVPERIKDERKAISAFKQEIAEKNKRLFYVSILFSKEYHDFIENLSKNFEQMMSPLNKSKGLQIFFFLIFLEGMYDETIINQRKKISFKFFEFKTLIYYTLVLRSNDTETQQAYFTWLMSKLDSVYIFKKFITLRILKNVS